MILFNLVMIANPIGAVITLVAGLAAVAITLLGGWEPVGKFFSKLWDGIVKGWDSFAETMRAGFDWLLGIPDLIAKQFEKLTGVFDSAGEFIDRAGEFLDVGSALDSAGDFFGIGGDDDEQPDASRPQTAPAVDGGQDTRTETTSRQRAEVLLKAEQGTAASMTQTSGDIDVKLANSGSMA